MPPIVCSCLICHTVFIADSRARKYCSKPCAAKGNYRNAALKRYKTSRPELKEIAFKIIERYIEFESNGSNYLNTMYLYEYGKDEGLIPDYVTKNMMKQHITRWVPSFGYEHIRTKTNALFRKIQPCETTLEKECAKA